MKCEVCGKEFVPKLKRSTCCSIACCKRKWRLKHRQPRPIIEKRCPYCFSLFKTNNPKKVYCNRTCAFGAYRLRHIVKRRNKAKKFYYQNREAVLLQQKYLRTCSKWMPIETARRLCEETGSHEIPYKSADKKKCEVCGKEFVPAIRHSYQKYCSDKCAGKKNGAEYYKRYSAALNFRKRYVRRHGGFLPIDEARRMLDEKMS